MPPIDDAADEALVAISPDAAAVRLAGRGQVEAVHVDHRTRAVAIPRPPLRLEAVVRLGDAAQQ
jgi:hypothetical protein